MEMGAEAVIIGEMSEFIVIACLEMGLPVIENLHSISEIPAIRRQAEILSQRFPDVRVEYIPSGATAFVSRKEKDKMKSYNPRKKPNPDRWLALDEDERIFLIEEFHERKRINLPNVRVHASIHAVVENQLASGDPPQAADTLKRLFGEGLDRHEAIHAIGSVLSEVMYHAMKSPSQKVDSTQAYIEGLEELTVEKWLASGE